MISLLGYTIVVYFIKILSGSRNFSCTSSEFTLRCEILRNAVGN